MRIPTSRSASTSASTTKSSDYTRSTVKLAQQWHGKQNGSGSGTSSEGDSDRESGGGNAIGKGTGTGRRPSRGGQNLSARYTRLENAVRGKQARAEAQAMTVCGEAATVAAAAGGTGMDAATGRAQDVASEVPLRKRKAVEMFRGLVVPEEPKPPADDECCMSGCAVCVYDLHEEELEAYESALSTLRASLVELGVPQVEWPARVRPASAPGSSSTSMATAQANASAPTQSQEKSRKGAVLSAFEEMERKLAEKHRAEGQAKAEVGVDVGSETGTMSGVNREQKQGVQPQAVAPTSPASRELDGSVNSITNDTRNNAAPHWRKRQQLAAQSQKAERRRTFWTELYEGVRWVLFSKR
ncbi:hypothetical protein D9619_010648 [Psilocybe cf. subviscida]|uniref:Oxidoreductase-like domain-containing protein n=1 Tax=Psilocybe cf. subviscida TaxID=2480587 RepID=A0A8H5B8R9_9AGAR|nr:hypothetical protein D9619_010648 [Psilocybe cf. subviscida]